ncbi:nicotinate-nucleotide adenylyltransferase [Sneathiella limimaris]|uniref:nicotinate-nucleotide adenylyltransferase n=1 Tax=Sneathiella limimaris TaxID=1964213 RepID=UPI00146B42D6
MSNKRKIGLLGGSFNPAHEGHLYISKIALTALGLDEVWWLVSPQNPLKSGAETAGYETRLHNAQKLIKDHRIKVSDFEQKVGQTYTAKTLQALKRCYPDITFVWLMGADNLQQIPKWHQWHSIFKSCPIAVFDRPGYTYQALNGKAAHRYRHCRKYAASWGRPTPNFANQSTPSWIFVTHTKHKLSSSYIRKTATNAGKACS